MIGGRRRIHQLISEPARPPQHRLVDIFILDFDFFVLMFKTVWRISMKLHMNDRWRESLQQLIFENSSAPWQPFLYYVGHFEICLC
jgi:hypothetical protein